MRHGIDIWQQMADGAFYGAACYILDYEGKADAAHLKMIGLQMDTAMTLKSIAAQEANRRHDIDSKIVPPLAIRKLTRLEYRRKGDKLVRVPDAA